MLVIYCPGRIRCEGNLKDMRFQKGNEIGGNVKNRNDGLSHLLTFPKISRDSSRMTSFSGDFFLVTHLLTCRQLSVLGLSRAKAPFRATQAPASAPFFTPISSFFLTLNSRGAGLKETFHTDHPNFHCPLPDQLLVRPKTIFQEASCP